MRVCAGVQAKTQKTFGMKDKKMTTCCDILFIIFIIDNGWCVLLWYHAVAVLHRRQ